MVPLRFITAGNFSTGDFSTPLRSARNDRTACHHRVSLRQETFCEWFPVRHGSIAFHRGRKLFAYSFLSGMAPLCFIAAGNFSTGDFSTPLRSARNDRTACHHRVSSQQETLREWFPIRHSSIAFHTGRKLFANSFLSGMAPLRSISTGNFSPIVSCPAWLHCVSYRQETIRVQFPIRHGSTVFHRGRKLFAYSFLSGMAPLRFISTGNYSQMVSHPAWLHCASSQ